jgi:hypothetical protein
MLITFPRSAFKLSGKQNVEDRCRRNNSWSTQALTWWIQAELPRFLRTCDLGEKIILSDVSRDSACMIFDFINNWFLVRVSYPYLINRWQAKQLIPSSFVRQRLRRSRFCRLLMLHECVQSRDILEPELTYSLLLAYFADAILRCNLKRNQTDLILI